LDGLGQFSLSGLVLGQQLQPLQYAFPQPGAFY
jgi:hypothetical protein